MQNAAFLLSAELQVSCHGSKTATSDPPTMVARFVKTGRCSESAEVGPSQKPNRLATVRGLCRTILSLLAGVRLKGFADAGGGERHG